MKKITKKLTKKQYNALKPLELKLKTAYYSDYKRAFTKVEMDLCYDILEELTEERQYRNYSCGQCDLNLAKAIGAYYFDYKNTHEKDEQKSTTKS